jgi:hypothetical protein
MNDEYVYEKEMVDAREMFKETCGKLDTTTNESLKPLLSSDKPSSNLSFSISCHLFRLSLMSSSTWLNHLIQDHPTGLSAFTVIQ